MCTRAAAHPGYKYPGDGSAQQVVAVYTAHLSDETVIAINSDILARSRYRERWRRPWPSSLD